MADVMGAMFHNLAIRCTTALGVFDSPHAKGPLCNLSKLAADGVTSRSAKICSVSTDGATFDVHQGLNVITAKQTQKPPIGIGTSLTIFWLIPKGKHNCRQIPIKPLKMIPGSCYLPKPGSVRGEDAHFICEDEQVIGVADGVGGWSRSGIDAGEFSRELMFHAVKAIREEPKGSIDLLRHIHALNIGDSGFIVVRKGSVSFRSPMQQHFFNCPYQLASGPFSDPPTAAEVGCVNVHLCHEQEMEFGLMTGDVIVAGTDGLFDNLFDDEVVEAVLQGNKDGLSSQEMASRIANLAWERAHDNERVTPFAVAAQDAGYGHFGGKIDDITVIVANVADGDT
ncbi:hypothetical protein ACLOJK_036156 [Asimina triloba]